MKRSILFIIIIGLFLAGCGANATEQPTSESDEFRVNVLYEHTVLMIQYSQGVNLEEIGLYVEYIEDGSYLTTDKKVERLMQAYNTTNSSIKNLENIMVVMMDDWAAQIE